MAVPIKIKRSSVAAKVPLTTDLELGELAVNTYDGKLYLKKNNGADAVVEIGGSGVVTVTDANSATTTGNYILASPYTNSGQSGAPGSIDVSVANGRIVQRGGFWNASFGVIILMVRTYAASAWTPWKQELNNTEGAVLAGITLQHQDRGSVSGTHDFDPSYGALHRVLMTGNTSFSFNAFWLGNNSVWEFYLEVQGAFTPSFSSVSAWIGGLPKYAPGMVYKFIMRKDNGGNLTIYGWGAGSVYTREYISSQQTITLAGALTLAHGLGVKPKDTVHSLVCTTAELGYAIGDEITSPIPVTFITITCDATNINCRYGSSGVNLVHKTTGVATAMTIANWRVVVRAMV